MFLSTLSLAEIKEDHLRRLISDGVGESRELEFKRDRIKDDRDAKREFLKDVTALANTFGGHLIIGMDERDGLADDLVGIVGHKPDDEKLRLIQLLRDSVEPSLIGVQIQEVPISSGGFALVIRIPRSWKPPHRVNMGWNRFFLRNSAGVSEMDVHQLRTVFLGAAEFEQRARSFRDERRNALAQATSIPRISRKGIALLQIVPIGDASGIFDIVEAQKKLPDMIPITVSGGLNYRPNLDGFFISAGIEQNGSVYAYSQLYRNGRFETAVGNLVASVEGRGKLLYWQPIETALVFRLPKYIMALSGLGFGLPFIVMLSLIGVRDSVLTNDSYHQTDPADRDDLLFEPLLIDADDLAGWPRAIKPLLDALYQAYGRQSCPNFDAHGNWITR